MTTTVLAYHAVAASPPKDDPHDLAMAVDTFRAQMDELARTRTVVSLADAVAGRVPSGKPAVAITFDDGYRGVLELAAPVLQDHGFPATLFVPTAHLGERNKWDDLHDPVFRLLDAHELGVVERSGIAVESHGHGHIPYDTSAPDVIAADIAASTEMLTEVLGRRPEFLAYPFGPSSPAARRAVQDAGYKAAFSIDAPHAGLFAYGRVPVQPGDGMRLFRFKTSGRYQLLRQNRLASLASEATRPIRRRLSRARPESGA
jgi:peptidoglycan/xylan/chitin deacetylase (PgdA/CDA1 family)